MNPSKALFFLIVLSIGFAGASCHRKAVRVSVGNTPAVKHYYEGGVVEEDHLLRDGDLLFQETNCPACLAIKEATRSPYSHMGVFFLDSVLGPVVFEAGPKVRYHPYEKWVKQGKDGHVLVLRHRKHEQLFTSTNVLRLRTWATKQLGKPYDEQFRWSDTAMYCSELVYKLFDQTMGIRIGETSPLKNYNLDASFVQEQLKQRYLESIPYDEPMISPADMMKSKLLYRVDMGG